MQMRGSLAALLLLVATAAPGAPACLSWGPEPVTLSGRLVCETFPGPPNYENIAQGDQAETYWILHLETSVCVGGVDDLGQDHSEAGIQRMQLVVTAEAYEKYRELVGRSVEVKGKLMTGFSGHHHTKVLLIVAELRGSEH